MMKLLIKYWMVFARRLTTRFITQAAREPAWIKWFDTRGILNSLFVETKLTAVDELLAQWLVDSFALERSEELILLISRHHMRLGSFLWSIIGRALGLQKNAEMEKLAFSRMVSLLLDTTPEPADLDILSWLG